MSYDNFGPGSIVWDLNDTIRKLLHTMASHAGTEPSEWVDNLCDSREWLKQDPFEESP